MKTPFTKKYQPKNLRDFHYDEDLTILLKGLMDMDRLNLLLIGNSGSGKTSTLQAIIREYYGPNADIGDNILSINSLQEQGISYYRNEVKIFCQTASCIPGKKKILLLDDTDVINEQSQQVFRNCIDKYSHNVSFLASCSNTQKVIESLQSRMDIVRLKTPGKSQLKSIASRVIDSEGIVLGDGVMDFIVRVCNGSVRILVNFLEKFKLIGLPIDLDTASIACTNISFSELETYTQLCKTRDGLCGAIRVIDTLIAKGYSVTDILDSYFAFVKITDILTEDEKYSIIPILCRFIAVFYNVHEDDIELKFFTNTLHTLLTSK
jgi:DNA polymerase III delta prime subunit